MNICQRELLEDDAGGGKVLDDLVHRGLGHLAVRALQIGELNQHQVLAGCAASGPRGLFSKQIACGGVRSCAEGYEGRPLNDVIAVRGDVHDHGLGLGVGRLANDENNNLGDVGRIRGLDGHHAPQPVGIIAPYLVEEGVHRLQRGRCGGKGPRICRRQRIGRHGLRNWRRGRSKIRRLRRGSGRRGRWGLLRWTGRRGLRQCHARAQTEDDNESCDRDPSRNGLQSCTYALQCGSLLLWLHVRCAVPVHSTGNGPSLRNARLHPASPFDGASPLEVTVRPSRRWESGGRCRRTLASP